MVGSAWTPWVRPTQSVSACSRARSASAAASSRARGTITSPARWSCSPSAVSSTSEEVRPKWIQRPAGPAEAPSTSTKAATSWSVTLSRSLTASTVNVAARIAVELLLGARPSSQRLGRGDLDVAPRGHARLVGPDGAELGVGCIDRSRRGAYSDRPPQGAPEGADAGPVRSWAIGMMSARTLARAALPLLLVAAAVVSSLQLEHTEDSRQAARMRVRTDDAVRQIRSRIGDYTDVLYGIRGLYEASCTVHGREFAAQVRGADVAARYPGVPAASAVVRVAAATALIVRRVAAPLAPNRSRWEDVAALAGGGAAPRARPTAIGLTGGPTAPTTMPRWRPRHAASRSFLPARARSLDLHGDRPVATDRLVVATAVRVRASRRGRARDLDLGPATGAAAPRGRRRDASPPARAPTRHHGAEARFSESSAAAGSCSTRRARRCSRRPRRGAVDRARRRAAAGRCSRPGW